MARNLQFTYNGITIGGSSTNIPVDIYRIKHGYPRSSFSCEFLVSGANSAAFASNCKAIEDTLRLPRQSLVVTLSGNSLINLDPATGVNSGFNADPQVERVSEAVENWGLVRRYRFMVTFDRPGDLSGQAGRRDETWTLHTDLLKRRLVTFRGTWTAMPGADAYAQYFAQSPAHFTTRLTQIDNTATWVKVAEDTPDDDTDKTVSYSTTFWEVINGRRESEITVEKSPSGVATVTITGTYIQTTGPVAARTNYNNNEPAHSTAVIGALGISAYELIREITNDNEQDQTLSFTRVYRELIHQQSPGVNDDPTIVLDTIELTIVHYPVNDSSAPIATTSSGVVNSPPPTGGGHTVSGGTTNPNQTQGANNTNGSPVRKLVDLRVRYTAWIDRSVSDLKGKWDNVLRGYMYTLISTKLKLAAALVVDEKVTIDPVGNRVVCDLVCQGTEGNLYALEVNVAKDQDFGVLATPVLGGKDHKYLLQKGPARTVFTKTVRAVFKTGAFDISTLYGVAPGAQLVLLSRSQPILKTRDFGITGIGQPTLSLTESQFSEVWLLVTDTVAAPGGGSAGGAGGGGAGAVPGVPSGGGGSHLGSGTGGGFSFADFDSIFGIGSGLSVDIGSS